MLGLAAAETAMRCLLVHCLLTDTSATYRGYVARLRQLLAPVRTVLRGRLAADLAAILEGAGL